jgi:chaperonin GroES
MRKDQLAAGARTAKFAVGGTAVPGAEDDIFRNVAPEGTRDESEIVVEHAPVVKQIFRPLGTTVLVRRKTVAEMSTIIIDEGMEKEKPAEGTIIAIGKKVLDVHPGEKVVFGKYAGTEFKLNGEVLLIMDVDDIKGTVEDEPTMTEQVRAPNTPTTGIEFTCGGCVVGRV